MAIDSQKLDAFMGQFVHDIGAVMHAATVVVGDQLGLYRRLAEGPATAEQLARKTETDPRYLREWLSAQAASGYVQHDPATDAFSMTEEQAFALAQEGSPAFIPGAFQIAASNFRSIGVDCAPPALGAPPIVSDLACVLQDTTPPRVVRYRLVCSRWPNVLPHRSAFLLGALAGGIGLLGIASPIEIAPGIILDSRMPLVALAGVAATMSAICSRNCARLTLIPRSSPGGRER